MTPEERIRLLRYGIEKGYWTLEDLDVPSPGWLQCEEDAKSIPGRTPAVWENPLREGPTPQPEPTLEPPEPTAAATPDNDDLFDF